MNSFLETFIQECIIDQLFYSTDDSNFELPPQQQCILICLSRPVVAPVLWEKNSGEARKTPRHLKTNHSLLSCIWDPFSVWTAVTVFPKASFKKPQYPPFDIKQSAFDPWKFDIPVKCSQSCFNCRWQLQSFGSGQEQPLVWLPSFCFAYQSSWQASKSIPNWERVCLSSSPSEAAVLLIVHPPACLPCSTGPTAGKEVVSCREEQSDYTPLMHSVCLP